MLGTAQADALRAEFLGLSGVVGGVGIGPNAQAHEFNPMMGHRGCRLSVTFPEIARMQTKAVIKAALAVQARERPQRAALEMRRPTPC